MHPLPNGPARGESARAPAGRLLSAAGIPGPSSRPLAFPVPARGFTLVEIVIAMIILLVGVLGMAGTTAYTIRQTTLAEATSKRTVALESVVERLRATPFDDLSDGSTAIGGFSLAWSVQPTNRSAGVTVRVTGPGLTSVSGRPVLAPSVEDSLLLRIPRR